MSHDSLETIDGGTILAVLAACSKLSPREREVLSLRSGFPGGDAMGYIAVGKTMGITRQGIRQIEAKALRKVSGYFVDSNLGRLDPKALFGTSIDAIAWSTHVYVILRNQGIGTIGELVMKSRYDFQCARNCGHVSLLEIESRLAALGLSLAQRERPSDEG